MAKAKNTIFFCQNCGYESAKWTGQCPGCKEWNTFVEEKISKTASSRSKKTLPSDAKVLTLRDVTTSEEKRMTTGSREFDRVLGGGLVESSLVLLGGDPGIGKSTILLQVCKNLSDMNKKVLYVSGEESAKQIKMRADRMGNFSENMQVYCETDLALIEEMAHKNKPDFMVIDSIQTMFTEAISSAPGSVSQVRESTAMFMQLAKRDGITIFVIGHVTKEGVVAGPRVLEHMVDTVLYFEGNANSTFRLLRGVKNRFGATNEIGVFEMKSDGLREVLNPSEYMLSGKPLNVSGSVVACAIEGTRPMLLEVQALASQSAYPMPRRTVAGTDYNRMNLLVAVIEKRLGLHLSSHDIYVNIAGGISMSEPAVDLAIVLAILSSCKEKVIGDDVFCFGEVGLLGEVRDVSNAQQRLKEASKLGFKKAIIPKSATDVMEDDCGLEIVAVSNIRQAYDAI